MTGAQGTHTHAYTCMYLGCNGWVRLGTYTDCCWEVV